MKLSALILLLVSPLTFAQSMEGNLSDGTCEYFKEIEISKGEPPRECANKAENSGIENSNNRSRSMLENRDQEIDGYSGARERSKAAERHTGASNE